MAKKKQTQKNKANRFSLINSYSEVLNNVLNDGETIFYARNCMLPILNIKILVKERSREELSDIDLMLFKLIEQGIQSIKSIVLLTGLADKLVRKHLNEMLGRSLVAYDAERFELTELGKETLEHGVPIRTVQRAFRYCAVTEQLLPRAAYDLVYSEIKDLRTEETRRFLRNSHVLEEEQMVSLSGMDFNKIDSKRELNITDEAISFGEVLGYTSGYLQTKLFLVGTSQPERAIVAFGKACKEYEASEILPMIQQLNRQQALQQVTEELEKEDIHNPELQFDKYGLPVVSIEKAGEHWLKKRIESGQQAVLLCGTERYVSKPVTSWKLRGYTVRYELRDQTQQQEVNLLREFTDRCESYYQVPYKEREFSSVTQFVLELYSREALSDIRSLAVKYELKRMLSWLQKETEEEAA